MFSETATAVLNARYLRHDRTGAVVEDPQGMMERVARAIARPCRDFREDANLWRERFLDRLQRCEFLPNSPTLMNAGIAAGQLAACFVLPIEDSLDSIFETLGLAARIQQTGGGTGFAFSALRPRGAHVSSTGGISSGPLSFIELFNLSTAVIRMGGRRRGANMAVLRVDHPDIQEFVEAKRNSDRLENFNLSVGTTAEFWECIRTGDLLALRDPRTGQTARKIAAQHLLRLIAESAWNCGDPGLLFLDEINRRNPVPSLGEIEATNPCGEQPLLPYESCTLGSVNLAKFASARGVNWHGVGEAVRDGVVFLDNVIEVTHFPSRRIEEATRRTRKIGLGVMGLADLLAEIGVGYGSDEGVRLCGEIARFIAESARQVSAELGASRGSFPAFSKSECVRRGYKAMRNATVTCVAPTGSISIIAGASAGIEPFFALAAERQALEGSRFIEINPVVENELKALGSPGENAMAVVRRTGSLRIAQGIPDQLKQRFPIALELEPEDHIRVQAAFQEQVDAAVSKTVNLPADATPEAVGKIFLRARELHLKGVTIYRYGSRPAQTLRIPADRETPDCRECSV